MESEREGDQTKVFAAFFDFSGRQLSRRLLIKMYGPSMSVAYESSSGAAYEIKKIVTVQWAFTTYQ